MSLKILLADDSLTAQNMGKKILTDAGYHVIAVSNGAQAIKKIVSELPDLVVLDVYMPGYSGVELCERIRQTRETATTPIVLSVGKMEPFRPEETMRVRADGLIIKPFEASELLAVVKKLAEKIAAAPPRRKPAPEPEQEEAPAAPQPMIEQEASRPEFETGSFDIPKEIAATPAIGMELITEEPVQAAPAADVPATPTEFEVEHAPEPDPVGAHDRTQLTSASGLSGVFNIDSSSQSATSIEPELPVAEAAIERFSTAVDIAAETATEPVHPAQSEPVSEALRAEAPAASDFAQLSEVPAEPVPQMEPPQPAAEPGESHAEEVSASHVSNEVPNPENVPEEQTSQPFVEAPVWESAPAPEERPVWFAEEVPVEPPDRAIPLHEQVQRLSNHPVEPATALLEPQEADLEHRVQWDTAPPATEIPQEPSLDHHQVREYFRPDFSLEEMAVLQASWPVAPAPSETAPEPQPTTDPHPELAPVSPVPQLEQAASAAAAEAVPQVTTALPDPARIAHIVEQVLERLRPELIAAVTRELEKKE